MASPLCQGMAKLTTLSTAGRVALSKPHTAAFGTASTNTRKQRLPLQSHQRPCIVAGMPPKCLATVPVTAIRHTSNSSGAAADAQVPDHVLTWNRFFDLRRKRRYVNLGSSVVTALGAIGIFGPVVAQQDLDGWAAQVSGIDPIIVLGLTTFAVAAGGWLCGPSLGNLGFKTWAGRKGWNRRIAEVSWTQDMPGPGG